MSKNFVQSIGEHIPGADRRTRRQNRLAGTGAVTFALLATIGGLKEPVANAAFRTKEVCVTTNGSQTIWGNAEEAKHALIESGVPINDTREVTAVLETSDPATVCGKMRIGFLSNIVGALADADIAVDPSLIAQESTEKPANRIDELVDELSR